MSLVLPSSDPGGTGENIHEHELDIEPNQTKAETGNIRTLHRRWIKGLSDFKTTWIPKIWKRLPSRLPKVVSVNGRGNRHRIPYHHIAHLSKRVFAAYSGPDGGLTNITTKEQILRKAGVDNWDCKSDRAYGIATSLYEYDHLNQYTTGDPVADVFAICARENNAVIVMADGVNWGDKPRLAARCAVYATMEYLNSKLYSRYSQIESTLDIFEQLTMSFKEAHHLIMKHCATMTTLTAAVVAELRGTNHYAVCVLNVGDSLAYVYNSRYGVREITTGCRDTHSIRDMSICGGALGPVDGLDPDLSNLTYSFTIAEPGDIVFLTSDGVSDNFDPVVAHRAIPNKPIKTVFCRPVPVTVEQAERQDMDDLLPIFDAERRLHDSLKHMEMALLTVEHPNGEDINASETCAKLLQYVVNKTESKRTSLEEITNQHKDRDCSPRTKRRVTSEMTSVMRGIPGKLDHAAIVAYKVGEVHVKMSKIYDSVEAPEYVYYPEPGIWSTQMLA